MAPILKSIALVALFTIGIWLVGALFGFDIALLPSLLLSVVLTALLNAGAIRRQLSSGSSRRDHV